MEYIFPKADAVQCIPEFNGSNDELQAFIYHIEHFAKEIPENESLETLIYVIILKLKGKAVTKINEIKADTWPEIKQNLRKEFGGYKSIYEVINEIETLRQGVDETFAVYKKRVLGLKEYLDLY